MKYFKNNKDEIFGIGVDQEAFIKDEWVEISKADVESIIDSRKTKEEKDKETENAEWIQYKADKEANEKTVWKLAGKPKYKA